MVAGIPYYPSVNDPDIRRKLMRKKEFNDIYHAMVKEDVSIVSITGYKNVYRRYLTTFLAPCTPYNRLLVVHGIGTGKTKCAIDICESLKTMYRAAIVLNKGDTATSNFRSQLGIYFTSMNKTKRESAQCMSYYTLDTYKKFAKHVKNMSSVRKKADYDNCVFIIDEVHNIVTVEHDDGDSVYITLLDLFDSLPNCVVVGMTATPMRDTYTEIIPLINMFVQPKDRIDCQPSTPSELDDPKHRFRQLVRGCVSYYQSTFSFDVQYKGVTYLGMQRAVVPVYMGDAQRTAYELCVTIDSTSARTGTFVYKDHTYTSLCTFPVLTHDTSVTHHKFILPVSEVSMIMLANGAVKSTTHTGFIVAPTVQHEMKQNIHMYSCKFAYILDVLEHTTEHYHRHWYDETECNKVLDTIPVVRGLAYVFCEDIKETGVTTLIALFKLFGYKYYTGGPIEHAVEDKRFTVYVGDKKICNNGSERLSFFRHPLNTSGKYCRVIIASNIMKESVSLSAVTAAFTITPHWNYSSIDQAEGRSVRRNAFERVMNLEAPVIHLYRLIAITSRDAERDIIDMYNEVSSCSAGVTHADLHQTIVSASIDMYKYYKSALKQVYIDNVMDIIKHESLDYYYNTDRGAFPQYTSLDTSTYSTRQSEMTDIVTRVLTTSVLATVGYMPLVDAVSAVRSHMPSTSFDVDSTIADTINYIVHHAMPIYDAQSNALYIKYRSEYLYVVSDLRNVQPSGDFSFVDLAYRSNKVSTYIDKRKYSVDDKVMQQLNSLSRYEFAETMVLKYMLHKISVLESALIQPDVYSNVVEYLNYNVYKCYTPILSESLYYHTMDTKRERTTSYSCTVQSVREDDEVYVCRNGIVERISRDMVYEAVRRINVIRKYRDLQMILKYGVYGSISLVDGARRIHDNYVENLACDTKQDYIAISDSAIDTAMNSTTEYTASIYSIALSKLSSMHKAIVIPSRSANSTVSDNRSQKRGRLLHTIQKVDNAMCIHKLIATVVPADHREPLLMQILSGEVPMSMVDLVMKQAPLTYYDLDSADIQLLTSMNGLRELHCYSDAQRLYKSYNTELEKLFNDCDKRLLIACGAYPAHTVEQMLWDILVMYDAYIIT